jgi:hypothetical protein
VKLGIENRKQMIVAAVLGVVLLLIVAYEFIPSSSTNASTTMADPASLEAPALKIPAAHHGPSSGNKERLPQSLDPTLHLQQLALTEQIKYEGSGRNIFVSQAEEVVIPAVVARANTDKAGGAGPGEKPWGGPPPIPPSPPIPLKFFGFSNQPGEPKKAFLSKGEDIFIAQEGEIIDRRYKVVRISPVSVDIQDVVGSGPPQSIPLTQGNPT